MAESQWRMVRDGEVRHYADDDGLVVSAIRGPTDEWQRIVKYWRNGGRVFALVHKLAENGECVLELDARGRPSAVALAYVTCRADELLLLANK